MFELLALGAQRGLEEIKAKLKKSKLNITIAQFSEIEIFIQKSQLEILINGKSLKKFDYVWLTSSWKTRSIAYAVFTFLKQNNIQSNQVEPENSKLVDMVIFAMNNIGIPKTFFSTTKEMKKRVASIEKFCKFPFIIKTTTGSLGKGIYLVESGSDFVNIVEKLSPNQHYICQEFIPNLFDYRVIIANGEVVSICQRKRQKDSFRNNSYLGAVETFLKIQDIPQLIINIAIESVSALNINWAGVDIVSSTYNQELYVLEINRRPGLTAGSSEISAAYEHILGFANR